MIERVAYLSKKNTKTLRIKRETHFFLGGGLITTQSFCQPDYSTH